MWQEKEARQQEEMLGAERRVEERNKRMKKVRRSLRAHAYGLEAALRVQAEAVARRARLTCVRS